jgi:arsenate reductase
MGKTIIYHNPRCSKSREALQILKDNSCEIEVVEYLKDTPNKEELTTLIETLGIAPHDLIRTGETIYKEQFKGKNLSNEAWIDAMVAYPVLIERPIVIQDGKAVIGRPPTRVLDILQ